MIGPDDELFKTEGPNTSVKVEAGEKSMGEESASASNQTELESAVPELPDIFSDDENPELTAALSDLGLISDSDAGSAKNESRLFDELLQQRIAKVRSTTADISQQLNLISSPQETAADNPEEL
jgi:hypothetical protein